MVAIGTTGRWIDEGVEEESGGESVVEGWRWSLEEVEEGETGSGGRCSSGSLGGDDDGSLSLFSPAIRSNNDGRAFSRRTPRPNIQSSFPVIGTWERFYSDW
jgi:hypothetical protein